MLLTWTPLPTHYPCVIVGVVNDEGYCVDWVLRKSMLVTSNSPLISVDLLAPSSDIEGLFTKLLQPTESVVPLNILVKVPLDCPQWTIAKTFLKTPQGLGHRVVIVTEDVRVFRRLSCPIKLWLKSISRKSFLNLVASSDKKYPAKFTSLLWEMYQYSPDSLLKGLSNPVESSQFVTYSSFCEKYGTPSINVTEVFIRMLLVKRSKGNCYKYLRKFAMQVHSPIDSRRLCKEFSSLSRELLTLKGILPEDREKYVKQHARYLYRYLNSVPEIPTSNLLYFIRFSELTAHEPLLIGYFGGV